MTTVVFGILRVNPIPVTMSTVTFIFFLIKTPKPNLCSIFPLVNNMIFLLARILLSSAVCRPWWLSWMHVRLVIRRLQVRPPLGRQHSFVESDHEIFSTVILSLLLIQEGHFSVSGERMCAILVNRLED